MKVGALERRARRIVHSGFDLEALCLAFDELLREHIPFAVGAWSAHDPATGLSITSP